MGGVDEADDVRSEVSRTLTDSKLPTSHLMGNNSLFFGEGLKFIGVNSVYYTKKNRMYALFREKQSSYTVKGKQNICSIMGKKRICSLLCEKQICALLCYV